MKNVVRIAATAALALSVSAAWSQAPAPKGPAAGKGDPKVAECRAHNQAEHKSLMEMHSKAMKEHSLNPAEQKHFKEMETRLHRHQRELAKGGLTLAECDKLGKEIAHEKTVLAKMAATPAKAPAKK